MLKLLSYSTSVSSTLVELYNLYTLDVMLLHSALSHKLRLHALFADVFIQRASRDPHQPRCRRRSVPPRR